MTDQPYTAEEALESLANAARFSNLDPYRHEERGAAVERDVAILAATLRDYQRVLAENADLKAHEARWTETVERQRKAADRHREERAALEAEVAALREDKARMDWLERAVPSGAFRRATAELMGLWSGSFREWVDAARSGGEGER